MRDLILLRHAEALQFFEGDDGERPLSLRGESEARAAGAWLREQGIAPDAVLCSTALRAQMTAERALDALGTNTPARLVAGIYGATPGELIALLESHAGSSRSVVLIGHNPGLEQLLALAVSGRSAQPRGMPPAAVAWLEWKADTAQLEPGSATLRAFWSP